MMCEPLANAIESLSKEKKFDEKQLEQGHCNFSFPSLWSTFSVLQQRLQRTFPHLTTTILTCISSLYLLQQMENV